VYICYNLDILSAVTCGGSVYVCCSWRCCCYRVECRSSCWF